MNILKVIQRHLGVSCVVISNETQLCDIGEHLNDSDFYTALKEISNDLGYSVRETDLVSELIVREIASD